MPNTGIEPANLRSLARHDDRCDDDDDRCAMMKGVRQEYHFLTSDITNGHNKAR